LPIFETTILIEIIFVKFSYRKNHIGRYLEFFWRPFFRKKLAKKLQKQQYFKMRNFSLPHFQFIREFEIEIWKN
jgi:hypothetical protein